MSQHAPHARLSIAPPRSSFVIAFSAVVLVVACGARGPLDDDGPLVSADAATTDGPTSLTDADLPDASIDGPSLRDAEPDAASEGGSIIDCGQCVIGTCGTSILMCLQSTGCRTTLQCVATTCLSGGTPDLACVVGCAAGDLSGALEIFQVFQCVTGTCGSDCGSVLGGLLGGLGGP